MQVCFTDIGETIYTNNRKNSRTKFKSLLCQEFINYICDTMISNKWSVDASIGYDVKNDMFQRSKRVCANKRILGNSIDNRPEILILELSSLKNEQGDRFGTVFKIITSENGLEFSELVSIKLIVRGDTPFIVVVVDI